MHSCALNRTTPPPPPPHLSCSLAQRAHYETKIGVTRAEESVERVPAERPGRAPVIVKQIDKGWYNKVADLICPWDNKRWGLAGTFAGSLRTWGTGRSGTFRRGVLGRTGAQTCIRRKNHSTTKTRGLCGAATWGMPLTATVECARDPPPGTSECPGMSASEEGRPCSVHCTRGRICTVQRSVLPSHMTSAQNLLTDSHGVWGGAKGMAASPEKGGPGGGGGGVQLRGCSTAPQSEGLRPIQIPVST